MLGVYIHIPFCKSICSYCDFCKMFYNRKYALEYLRVLEKEIDSRYTGEMVDSIYVGGGTPTVLDNELLFFLMKICNKFKLKDKYEFTVESNIESIDEDKLKILKDNGVNRISFGVESFDDKILKILGRSHRKAEIYEKITLTKSYFDNINIDLIYGVNNDIGVVKRDIDNVLKLNINHVSCYSLILENHTKLVLDNYKYISDDISYEMYNYIRNALDDNNFIHYEISNYSKDGYESLHNKIYWLNQDYYGFGLSSVSYLNYHRISNTKNMRKYLNGNYVDNNIYENDMIRKENGLILGLRLIDGIDVNYYNEKYSTNLLDYDIIKEMIDDNKLEVVNNKLKIREEYIYLSNQILCDFIGGLK